LCEDIGSGSKRREIRRLGDTWSETRRLDDDDDDYNGWEGSAGDNP
jgi:hypothetical protein